MGAIFVKGAGAKASDDLTYVNGASMSYVSSSTTGTKSVTASASCRVLIIFTRSNRNTSDALTWTIQKNGTQQERFTAPTGGMAATTREYLLDAGDVLTTTVTGVGYAGGRSFFVATGSNIIS